jgi:hypothetical protein
LTHPNVPATPAATDSPLLPSRDAQDTTVNSFIDRIDFIANTPILR